MKYSIRFLTLLISAVLMLGIVGSSFAEGDVPPPEAAETTTPAPEPTPPPTSTATPAQTPAPESVPITDTPPASDEASELETESPDPDGEGTGEATELPPEDPGQIPIETPTETPTETPMETPTQAPTEPLPASVLSADFADRAAVLILGEQSLDITEQFSYFLYNAPATDEYTLTVDGALEKEGYIFRDPGDSDPALAEALASGRNTPEAPLTLKAGLELNAKYVLALRLVNGGEERVTVTLSALTPEPSLEPEEEPQPELSQEDYYLSLLDLGAYTFKLNSEQKEYKAFGRESVGLYRSMKEGKQYVKNQAMVCVRSEGEARQVAAAYRATLLNYNGDGLALLELSDEVPTEIILVLSTREDVPLPALEPNRIKRLYAEPVVQSIPSDPSYKKQYFHKNMGNELAWDHATGAGVTVAVIDTGCLSSHVEFSGKISSGSARFDSNGDIIATGSNRTDPDGHGTHVSGIIAANKNNGYGGCGVAPDATLLICQMDGLSNDDGLSDYALIAAMNYVAGRSEVKVVNMSLGSHYSWGYSLSEKTAVQDLTANKLVVVAAGNENYGRAGFPAAFEEVLAVSATTSSNKKASYSNYGPEVDIAAPGSGIYSTMNNGSYDTMDGTSMASPAVAGAAAVIISEFDCTPAEARKYLISSAKDLKNANYYGSGLVQTGQAVTGRNVVVKSGSVKGGTVSGGGFYEYGVTPRLEAFPNTGYTFVNWKKGSKVVSASPVYEEYEVQNDGAVFTASFMALPKASVTAKVCSYSSNLITWKALPNATSYRVLHSDSSKGPFTPIGTEIPFDASKTVYTYEDLGRTIGAKSCYKVAATFPMGYTESSIKSVKTAWPTMKISKAVQAGPSANRVTWNKVPNETGYLLTRTIGKTKEIMEVLPDSQTITQDPKLGTLVTYEDIRAGISMGASCSYQVQAYVGNGADRVLSKTSGKKTIKAGWSKVAAKAASGAYINLTDKYPITITITPAPNASGHELWWSLDKKNWNKFSMTGSTHVIKGIQPGVPVYVQVRPYMGSYGNPTAVGPWATLTTRSVPTAPIGFYVLQNLWQTGTRLYWSNKGFFDLPADASGYEVYQSKNLGKSFTKVKPTAILHDEFWIDVPVTTTAQVYARMGWLYKMRSYVIYKGTKYYGPFTPIVVAGDVNNSLYEDWNSTAGTASVLGDRLERLEALLKDQKNEISIKNTLQLDPEKWNRLKTNNP